VGNLDGIPTLNRTQSKAYSDRDINRARNAYNAAVAQGNQKKANAAAAQLKKFGIRVK
jgi:hypothetical protein